jgi:hypothetical protein
MKYFTPELYIQGNSSDERLVDQAEEAWEQAVTRYRRHYRKIKPQLPEAVRKFHDEYCLHDAAVFGPAKLSINTLPWGFQDVVIVAQNIGTLYAEHLNTLMFLQYAVTAEPVIEVPVPSEHFSRSQPYWLYDEIDAIEPGVFSHEILLSDGRVVKLRFRELRFHLADLVHPVCAAEARILPDKAASA